MTTDQLSILRSKLLEFVDILDFGNIADDELQNQLEEIDFIITDITWKKS